MGLRELCLIGIPKGRDTLWELYIYFEKDEILIYPSCETRQLSYPDILYQQWSSGLVVGWVTLEILTLEKKGKKKFWNKKIAVDSDSPNIDCGRCAEQ
jgi:hypothetical protein